MEKNIKISARNQIKGKVLDIVKGDIVAQIKIQIEPATITAVITKEAAESLDIKNFDDVIALIKATEVMIGKEY